MIQASPELDIEDARRLSAVESEGFCGGEESMLGRVRGRDIHGAETSLRLDQRPAAMLRLERHYCPQVVCAPDHALCHDEDDLARVRRWFHRLQLHVQSVDYVGARALFAEDVVTFGTFSAFTIGREATEKEQWRHIWSRIDGFRWRLDDLRVIISGDRQTAVGMALFESVGYTEEGTPYERPGRCTVVLGRATIEHDWVAQHIHASLFQGIPARSFGTKPEHRPVLSHSPGRTWRVDRLVNPSAPRNRWTG